MSCKAWNGRVVLEYLASVSRLACSQAAAAGAGRIFGSWLAGEVRIGARAWPLEAGVVLQAKALKPGSPRKLGCLMFVLLLILQQWNRTHKLLRGLQCLRTGLARWFGLTEKSPRFLTQQEANEIYREGMVFIESHVQLSILSVRWVCS